MSLTDMYPTWPEWPGERSDIGLAHPLSVLAVSTLSVETGFRHARRTAAMPQTAPVNAKIDCSLTLRRPSLLNTRGSLAASISIQLAASMPTIFGRCHSVWQLGWRAMAPCYGREV
jgi:hypothetical protein